LLKHCRIVQNLLLEILKKQFFWTMVFLSPVAAAVVVVDGINYYHIIIWRWRRSVRCGGRWRENAEILFIWRHRQHRFSHGIHRTTSAVESTVYSLAHSAGKPPPI